MYMRTGWHYFCPCMAGTSKRTWQDRHVRRPFGQLDFRMDNYRMGLVIILGHKKVVSNHRIF